MSNCTAKHTIPQVSDEDFRCHVCGATPEDGFAVDYPDPDSDVDCTLLHDRDEIVCTNCNQSWTGRQFITRYKRKQNLVACPHCHGKGVVKLK